MLVWSVTLCFPALCVLCRFLPVSLLVLVRRGWPTSSTSPSLIWPGQFPHLVLIISSHTVFNSPSQTLPVFSYICCTQSVHCCTSAWLLSPALEAILSQSCTPPQYKSSCPELSLLSCLSMITFVLAIKGLLGKLSFSLHCGFTVLPKTRLNRQTKSSISSKGEFN